VSRGRRRAGDYQPPRRPASFNAPTAPEVVIQPRMTRREERRLRKRQQRRKLGLAGGIGAALIGVVIAVTVAVGVQHVVTHDNGNERTQVTVLLQIQQPNGDAGGSVLLAADPADKQGLEVLVPSRLITEVCGHGSLSFGSILGLPGGAAASRGAMSGVLGGVIVDGSWVLTDAEMARLIDSLGGVSVDVDTSIVRRTPGGAGRVLVAAGPGQRLTGAQAVAYATYERAREGAAAQLERLHKVVDATVRAMRRSAQSTIGAARLGEMLYNLASYDRLQAGVFPTDLPTVSIDAGGAFPSYRADTAADGIPMLVKSRLSQSLPPNANRQHASVLLLNGLGTPGLVASACPRLAAAGFTYAGSGNAPTFSRARSQVDIFRNADAEQGYALADALGLPRSDVRRNTLNQNVATFVVILGSDYRP
jgi:hypothetical protein